MRSLLSLCLPALVLWSTSAHAQQVEPRELVLDNGMTFLLYPRDEQPGAISAGWVAHVGSVDERPGMTGISHFFEHMMFKGTSTIGTSDPVRDAELRAAQSRVRDELRDLQLTENYERWRAGEIDDPWDPANDTPAMAALRTHLGELQQEQRSILRSNEFDEIYAKNGGSGMNAFTSYDLTFYYIDLPANRLELWAWLESDRLADSVFREFFTERDVVHEERRMRTESTPTGPFREQFDAMFWGSSPYTWPVIGWPTDLESYTLRAAQDYFDIYYRPNNLTGVVVGDFDVNQVEQLVRRYFGRLERGPDKPAVITLEMKQKAEKRMLAQCDCPPQIEVRYHTVPFGHADAAPLDVLSDLLNGPSGRLFRTMIEGDEVASSARAGSSGRRFGGYLSMQAEAKGAATPDDLERVWNAQVQRLKTQLVDARELQRVKNNIVADSYRRLKDNQGLMFQFGYYEALGGWEWMNLEPERLLAVTAEDVQRVARAYLTPENRSVAVYTRKPTSPADAPAGGAK